MQDSLLLEIAKDYGTPVYVYDTDKIESQYKRLINAFDVPELEIHFACKALNNPNILKVMKGYGANIDAVSIQEVKIALNAGFKASEILYTPNCVSFSEIKEARELGVNLNLDNISILEQFGHEFPETPVCIRINPHIMAGGNSKISVGHIDSKFGISIYQLPLVKRIVQECGMKVNGLHMHTGSDILDTDVFLNGAELLFESAMEFDDLEFLDFGSGFKVPYKDGDIETDIEELGKRMSARFNEFCKNYGKDLKLVFEPGKFLVSEAGNFLASVNVIKQTTSTIFAGLDSGLNHMIRPMFYDAYHHIENISNTSAMKRLYTIVGYICETDTFGWNRKLNEIREGDVLKFNNAGAYCFTMSSNYNSRLRPAEVMIWKGKAQLIRKRESLEDLTKNVCEIDL
jgi:diaminopimelate decarboxylase